MNAARLRRSQKESPPPSPPRSCEKIQAAGNWGSWECPGEGKFPAAKTGAYFSVARSVSNSPKPKDPLFGFIRVSASADVALRKTGQCFTALYLPPGFDGRKFPLPRATKEAFAPGSFFSQLPPSRKRVRVRGTRMNTETHGAGIKQIGDIKKSEIRISKSETNSKFKSSKAANRERIFEF
jgi:hypothetical protein